MCAIAWPVVRGMLTVVPCLLLLAGEVRAGGQETGDLQVPAEGGTPEPKAADRTYVIENCRVDFISKPELAFEEPGVITQVPQEGDKVTSGEIIATLNDAEIQLRIETAKYAYLAAKEESENKVKITYAQKNAEASYADWMSGVEANNRTPNVVPEMEMRRRKLEYQANKLAIENSSNELAVAALTASGKEAELKTTQALLKRLQLKSPITGQVIDRIRDVGEYARPGDAVVRVGQLDRLRVQGRIDPEVLAASDARGRAVTIRVDVGRDATSHEERWETFQGTIQHVDAEFDDEGKYLVWTEIENTKDFLILPGMPAEMTIEQ